MKVLWVCNIMLPVIARNLNLPYSNREGWLSGAVEKLLSSKNAGRVTLGICFPTDRMMGSFSRELSLSEEGSCMCYGFEEDLTHPEKYNEGLEARFKEIFADFEPDMIHIFGTEFPHTLAAVRAFGRPERTLIGIQGVCAEIAEQYTAGIPLSVKYIPTLRDILKKDSIYQQIKKFELRGVNEAAALSGVMHIAGRTEFDKRVAKKLNPKAMYHVINETMRSCFYQDSWHVETCERERIFLSQGDYPLKGFHYVLQALPKILERHPGAMVYVAGANLMQSDTWKDRLKRSGYGRYLKHLIRKYRLQDHVVMLGRLNETQMKEQYLKCHVFVCPSSLENSPNSLGEAMLLGVPCVASQVGGIPDLLDDGRDGILVPPGDIEALASRICEVMEKDDITRLYSINAKKHAYRTHDSESNFAQLLIAYVTIVELS